MTQVDNTDNYDYIVIGGGTSGAVLARRLAETEANYSVCLLEAGPSHKDVIDSHMPGRAFALFRSVYDWDYETVPQKACNDRTLATIRGRVLGGSSAMNGTLIIRGVKADYDRIASMGNTGWSWEEMMPFFNASETFHPAEWFKADLSVHGSTGPLHTGPQRLAPISEKVLESFIDMGYVYKPDMFAQGEFEGVGHAIRTVHNGVRTTSADFVYNFEKKNLTVRTGVFVNRIILEKSEGEHGYRAVGIETYDDESDQSIIIRAKKEIILSAGAYNSPMILMHSGIGCVKHLADVGISCKIDLPGVGSNLLDHPHVFTSYQVSDPNLSSDLLAYCNSDVLESSVNEWHDSKTGLMTRFPFGPFALKRIDKTIQDPIWEAAKSLHQGDDQSNYDPSGQLSNQPHIEFWTTELYFDPFLPEDHEKSSLDSVNGENAAFTLITLLCGPKSRGTVRLSSNDPRSKPIIDHAQLEHELDLAVLAEGCRLGHEVIMKGCGTKNIVLGPWPTMRSHPKDLDGWKKHVRKFSNTCFHPGGTCKMAPSSDPLGVVDHRLRVRGIQGLRVADVSILPILNSGHTQAPAYAIGEKAAHMILQGASDS